MDEMSGSGRGGRPRGLWSVSCLLVGALWLGACAGAQRAPEPARVRFLIEPETARVYNEDRFVGAARVLARRPEAFQPGLRHFTITADGYFPHDVELDLPSGLTTVRLRLRPIPR